MILISRGKTVKVRFVERDELIEVGDLITSNHQRRRFHRALWDTYEYSEVPMYNVGIQVKDIADLICLRIVG